MWTLKVCPECNEAVALVNTPVHVQGCTRPDIVWVEVLPTTSGYMDLAAAKHELIRKRSEVI